MAKSPTVFLRVKRPCSEPPVELFSAIPLKKRRHDNVDCRTPTCFRYLGTTSSLSDTINPSADDLQDMGASGERKLILSQNSIAHVLDSPRTKIPCTIRVSTTDLISSKRKAEMEEAEDEVENEEDGEVRVRNSFQPPPAKSLRIIDLSYQSQSDPLAMTLNGLTLVPESTSKGEADTLDEDKAASAEDDNFLYDLYAISTNFDEDIADELDDEPPLEGIYEGNSDEFDESFFYDGEDSDSNSELNWRNDYPDEEDVESSDSRVRDSDLDEYGYHDIDSDDDDHFSRFF
ncbi:expressed conserved protein [Echinococcus multilocularis]|uniref:Expressed conserved protein n=1 Tax=Echinococcus multilocularis TaxID=6211 RepID=A0A068Y9Z5_ECHMU|nr:expressed conserved protein [Echinococcus multilocularis]